jgi:hypothetical protein
MSDEQVPRIVVHFEVDKQLRLQRYYFRTSPDGEKKVTILWSGYSSLFFRLRVSLARIRLMRQHGTRLFCRKAYF